MIAQGLSEQDRPPHGPHQHVGRAGIDRGASPASACKRRIFVHINNSNPVLREDSPERREVERAGWEVAFDGMEIRL